MRLSGWPVAMTDSFSLNILQNYTVLALFALSFNFLSLSQNSKSLDILRWSERAPTMPKYCVPLCSRSNAMPHRKFHEKDMKVHVAKFHWYNRSGDGIFVIAKNYMFLVRTGIVNSELHSVLYSVYIHVYNWLSALKREMRTCLHMHFHAIWTGHTNVCSSLVYFDSISVYNVCQWRWWWNAK